MTWRPKDSAIAEGGAKALQHVKANPKEQRNHSSMSKVPSALSKHVEDTLVFWQKALRLQDWTILVEWWPHRALDGAVSQIEISRNQQSATLALRFPEDMGAVEKEWPPDEAGDYEMSIVHELIHIKLNAMESEVEWAEEQVCNHLTTALVGLARKQS